tara:strand:+ start:1047 stop:1271 length:225 start_codon:yes stop_codon:yes gene_type:complete
MRKLIDRLKPEYKVKLAEVENKYPAIFERTMMALNTEVIYGDLKVYDAYNLAQFLTDYTHKIDDLNSVLFEPLK